MSLLDSIERRLRRYAVPRLTEAIIIGRVLTFLIASAPNADISRLELVPHEVFAGEVWRVITFMIVPPSMNPIWLFFSLYLFWIMGRALDNHWGTFRYNVFLLVGWLLTVLACLATGSEGTAWFIDGSVFLAFAYLYPEFQLLLFFIIPVKIKWLAVLAWIFLIARVVDSPASEALQAAAGVVNFFLFFGRDIVQRLRGKVRGAVRDARNAAERDKPFHCCTVCGATEKSDPELEFRYCPRCTGSPCYCDRHIREHEHR